MNILTKPAPDEVDIKLVTRVCIEDVITNEDVLFGRRNGKVLTTDTKFLKYHCFDFSSS